MGKHEAPDIDDCHWRKMADYQVEQLRGYARHLDQAHAAIDHGRRELRALNDVIVRRKRNTRRLRMYVDAVNELHRPVNGLDLDHTTCREDGQEWPCRTHSALETVAMEALKALVRQGNAEATSD